VLVKVAVAVGVVAVAAAAGILANLALLGYAQPRNDPVGRLSPRAVFAPAPGPPPQPRPPTREHDEHDD
jgi:hypothetical protein